MNLNFFRILWGVYESTYFMNNYRLENLKDFLAKNCVTCARIGVLSDPYIPV